MSAKCLYMLSNMCVKTSAAPGIWVKYYVPKKLHNFFLLTEALKTRSNIVFVSKIESYLIDNLDSVNIFVVIYWFPRYTRAFSPLYCCSLLHIMSWLAIQEDTEPPAKQRFSNPKKGTYVIRTCALPNTWKNKTYPINRFTSRIRRFVAKKCNILYQT